MKTIYVTRPARTNDIIEPTAGARITSISGQTQGVSPDDIRVQLRQEVLTDSSDGVTVDYTLIKEPIKPNYVMLFINGLLQKLGRDFNINVQHITLSEAPPAGSNIIAHYEVYITC
jgi:hypothetical protein